MNLRRLLPVALIVVLLAAACGTSGAPTGYAPDEGGETLHDNFTEGCEVALEDDPQASQANEVCECSYEEIVRTIPFDDFKELDDELRNDVEAINDTATGVAVTEIVAGCIRQISNS